MNTMSFATFIYPENVQQVLRDMIEYFNYINSIEFDLEQFNKWKSGQEKIHFLINNYKYDEVVQA